MIAVAAAFPLEERPRAQIADADLLPRIGSYIAGFVEGFSNVVAQEDFDLRRPKRKVRSEFLLVRFPGAVRDMLTFRDVLEVNGTPVSNRQESLAALFLKPPADSFRRANEINLNGADHVPPVLNPLFAIGFLQSEFQSRFEFKIKNAGGSWPRGTKAVSFIERSRPTLLRTGPLYNVDVETRGTAWVEEATGRVLETELQVREGRVVTLRTKFKQDEGLAVTVPVEMKTKNPDGTALYSNFRRFTVQTDEAIAVPQEPREQ